MKVLILSITAGQGHHACGAAISDYLKSKGVQCRMLDCLSYINKLLGESVSQGYLLSTQYSPAAYGKLYRLAEKKEKPNGMLSLPKMTVSLLAKKLENYCLAYEPPRFCGAACNGIYRVQGSHNRDYNGFLRPPVLGGYENGLLRNRKRTA